MRIVCDNCGAKYQISDDKVRNKVFKIRCKRCAHVIVVRSQGDEEEAGLAGGADEDSTRVGNHPAPEPAAAREPSQEAPLPAADAVWYIVINREQVGPLTKAQIQGHLRHGEVDAEAFTWREGMPDWTRLGAIPEFAGLFPAPAAAEPVAPAPEPEAAETGTVMVSSSPEKGLTIRVDGKVVGKTPLKFKLPAGSHDIKVEGYSSQSVNVIARQHVPVIFR